jgi:hypothetical protein
MADFRREGVIHKELELVDARPLRMSFERRSLSSRGYPRGRLGPERQYTAPRAVIGQICSTRLPRTQTYQS